MNTLFVQLKKNNEANEYIKYLEKRLNLPINAKLFSNNFLEYENMYISDTQRKGVSIMAFVKFCYLNMKLCIMS